MELRVLKSRLKTFQYINLLEGFSVYLPNKNDVMKSFSFSPFPSLFLCSQITDFSFSICFLSTFQWIKHQFNHFDQAHGKNIF